MQEIADLSLEDGNVQESKEGPSEQAMKRVQENIKKAKKAGKQVKQSQMQNSYVAKMLSIIFSHSDDKIIKDILVLLEDYDLEVELLFKFYLPIVKTQVEGDELFDDMKEFYNNPIGGVVDYSNYINDLIKSNPKLKDINKNYFIKFIRNMIICFNIGNMKELSKSKNSKEIFITLEKSLKKEFYGL